ncbi:MAG: YggS family pyridoxal phosphate-dependent enzyme, partial [Boseongicola sp. SB0662_bin_57]|nr:YggS family pyridoxal phosphate-dependent enzyme [Boseongicola sp. SB0662_bin_57]
MSLTETRSRIARAADAQGRDGTDISLIAVSKLQPLDRIEAVLGQGHRVFGENRLQEAQGKWPAFRERFPDIELHLVGALQTNKARAAMA